MGFGITGVVQAITQKALIRYVPKKSKLSLEEIDNKLGEWSWLGQYTLVGTVQSLANDIKNITPDVRKGETLRLSSDVTEYAVEDGSIIAQHIIQRPLEVTLTFEETNTGKMIGNIMGFVGETFFGMENQSLYDKLLEIWEDKLQVEITTDQDIYKNMVVKSMPIMQASPYKGAYKVMCSFTQITTPGMIRRKGKTSAIQKACSALVQGGRQLLTKVSGD